MLAGAIHLATTDHIPHVFQSKTTQYRCFPLLLKHGNERLFVLTKIALPF